MLKWSVRGLILVLVLGAALLGYRAMFAPPVRTIPELAPLHDLVYRRVAAEVADGVPEAGHRGRLLLAPIAGDPGGALRARVADALEFRYPGLTVDSSSLAGSSWPVESDGQVDLGRLATTWLERWLRPEDPPPSALLAMRVVDRRDDTETLELAVEWGVHQPGIEARGASLRQARATIVKSLLDIDYARTVIQGWSVSLRLMGWLLWSAVCGLAALPIARRTLRLESNFANGALLVLVAIPGAIAAWILTGFGAGFAGGAMLFLGLGLSLAGSYVYLEAQEAAR